MAEREEDSTPAMAGTGPSRRTGRARIVPRVHPLPPTRVEELLVALAARPGLAVLEAPAGEPARYELVAFDPLRSPAAPPLPRRPAELDARLADLVLEEADAVPGPFAGGFLGAFAYDLGLEGGPALPPDPWRAPPVVGGYYTDFCVLDRRRGEAWLVLGEGSGDGRPPLAARREAVLADLERARAGLVPASLIRTDGPLVRHLAAGEYRRRVEAVRALVAAGEVYQANLAHRFTRRVRGSPLALYLALRATNPAPYMGYLAWSAPEELRGALLSASPELLLEMRPGEARTRPIKGTAPRDRDAARDRALAEGLLASAKDRAELAMIVDLERNDLARVSRPGSVRVEGFPRLESHPSVHHLVADVVAEPLAPPGAVLESLFPGGSISGAPKRAALEAIARLEGEGRGFFTGTLGFQDVRGRATWNVLIRTLVWRPLGAPAGSPAADETGRDEGEPGEVSFHVGAGITWDSDPEAEERETLWKGERLAAALERAGEGGEGAGRSRSAVRLAPGSGGADKGAGPVPEVHR